MKLMERGESKRRSVGENIDEKRSEKNRKKMFVRVDD